MNNFNHLTPRERHYVDSVISNRKAFFQIAKELNNSL